MLVTIFSNRVVPTKHYSQVQSLWSWTLYYIGKVHPFNRIWKLFIIQQPTKSLYTALIMLNT